jgi:succinoglycan biosynthesis transport protein ExoP
MSHVRNLFQAPSAQAHELAPALVAPPALAAVEASAVPRFSVEQAHIRPQLRLVIYTEPHSSAADRFRFLRVRLQELQNTRKLKRLLVTSPLPQEGKSTLILNLATALSERGKRAVLLLEADLHHSCLTENLGLKTWPGLTECLHDSIDPLSAIRRIDPFGWHLLPAGEPSSNPIELLQSSQLGTVMQRITPHFDWILIDSPPVVPLTDAVLLQKHSDASLLVIRAGRTSRNAVEQATAILGPNHFVGFVLNGVEPPRQSYYSYPSE